MNNIQDKQYLALELTKILYNDNIGLTRDGVYESYEGFLKSLTNTLDEIGTICTLKNELERLQEENKQLKANNRDILEPFKDKIVTVLNESKGDMEHYVYAILMGLCGKNER